MKLRLPPVLLFLGVVLAMLLVVSTGWAQEGVDGSFPWVGLTKQLRSSTMQSFTMQWQLFTGIGSTSALFYLALTATLIGTLLVIFNKKNQSITVILPWFILVTVMLFAPYNSKLLFYPIGTQSSCTPGSKSTNGACGFTPQIVMAHVGTAITLIMSDILGPQSGALIDAQNAAKMTGEVERIANQIPPEVGRLFSEYNKNCGATGNTPAAETTSATTAGTSAQSGKTGGYTLNGVAEEIKGFFNNKNGRAKTAAYSSPVIGLYTEKPPSMSESDWGTYKKAFITNLYSKSGDKPVTEKEIDLEGGGNTAFKKAVVATVDYMTNTNMGGGDGFGSFSTSGAALPNLAAYHVTAVDASGKPIKNTIESKRSQFANGGTTQTDPRSMSIMVNQGNSGGSIIGWDGFLNAMKAGGLGNMPVARVRYDTGGSGSGNNSATVAASTEGNVNPNCSAEQKSTMNQAIESTFGNSLSREMIQVLKGESSTLSCLPNNCNTSNNAVCAVNTNCGAYKSFAESVVESLKTSPGNSEQIQSAIRGAIATAASRQQTPAGGSGGNNVENAGQQAANSSPQTLGWMSGVGGFAGEVGKFLAGVSGKLFSGILAAAVISIVKLVVEMALMTVIILTPFVFLMGLLIPTNASGILFYTTVSVLVLKLVPMTMIVIDGIASILYILLGNLPGGLDGFAAQGALMWAVAGMYLYSVSMTMFLMFKIGDASNLSKLTSLDGAAKQIADVGVKATQALALAAAGVAGGAAMGAFGAAAGSKGAGAVSGALGKIGGGAQAIADKAGLGDVARAAMNQGTTSSEADGASLDDYMRNPNNSKIGENGQELFRVPGSNEFITRDMFMAEHGDMFAAGSSVNPSTLPYAEDEEQAKRDADSAENASFRNDFSLDDDDTTPTRPQQIGGISGDVRGQMNASGDEPEAASDNVIFNPDGQVQFRGQNVGTTTDGVNIERPDGSTVTVSQLKAESATAGAANADTLSAADARAGNLGNPERTPTIAQPLPEQSPSAKTNDMLVQADTLRSAEEPQRQQSQAAGDESVQPQAPRSAAEQASMEEAVRRGTKEGLEQATPVMAKAIGDAPARAADAGKALENLEKADAQKAWDALSGWEKFKRGGLAGAAGAREALGGGIKSIPVVGNMLAEVWNEKDQGSIRAKAMFMAGAKRNSSGEIEHASTLGSYGAYKKLKKGGELAKLWSQEEGVLSSGTAFRETERAGMNMGGFANAINSGQQNAAGIIAEYEGRRQANQARMQANKTRGADAQLAAINTSDYVRTKMLSSVKNSMDISEASIVIKDGQFTMKDGQNLTTLQRMSQVAQAGSLIKASSFGDDFEQSRLVHKMRTGFKAYSVSGSEDNVKFADSMLDTAKSADALNINQRAGYEIKAEKNFFDKKSASAARKRYVANINSLEAFREDIENAKTDNERFSSMNQAAVSALGAPPSGRNTQVNNMQFKLDAPMEGLARKFASAGGRGPDGEALGEQLFAKFYEELKSLKKDGKMPNDLFIADKYVSGVNKKFTHDTLNRMKNGLDANLRAAADAFIRDTQETHKDQGDRDYVDHIIVDGVPRKEWEADTITREQNGSRKGRRRS